MNEEQEYKSIYDANESYFKDKMNMIQMAFAKASGKVGTIDFNKMKDTSSSFTKQQLVRALSSKDESDVKTLVQASNYFYRRSGEYRQLLHRFAGIHKFRSVVFPYMINDMEIDMDKNTETVANYIISSDVSASCQDIMLKALLDGTAYTYENEVDGKVCTQFLPSDYCRTRMFDNYGNRLVELNFKYFEEQYSQQEDRDMIFKNLPKEFKKLYNSYKSGKSNIGDTRNPQWQMLSSDYARATTLTLDGSPYFCAIMPDLVDYEEYKAINKLSSTLDLFKVLVQKTEFDKEGNLVVDDDTMDNLHDALVKVASSGGCGALTTPFDVKALSLKDNNEQKQDYIQTGLTGIYNSASLPEISFNSNSKNGGTAGLKSSNQMLDGVFSLVISQFKRWYSKKINALSSNKVMYNIHFLNITCFNEGEQVGYFKEQALAGGGSLDLYYASLGIGQFDYQSILKFEKARDVRSLLSTSVYTTASSDDNTGGGVEKEVEDKSDITNRQEDNGISDSRAKE